jgi:hypothetical protein
VGATTGKNHTVSGDCNEDNFERLTHFKESSSCILRKVNSMWHWSLPFLMLCLLVDEHAVEFDDIQTDKGDAERRKRVIAENGQKPILHCGEGAMRFAVVAALWPMESG